MSAASSTTGSSTTTSAITAAVQRLYEAFPYPRYPLLAKPRWQDGYLTSSLFAARLLGRAPCAGSSGGRATVLIGGSGEILPYVVRRWEPGAHDVLCLDLSAASLARARIRLGWRGLGTSFARGDLAAHLEAEARRGSGRYAHVDAYGVLHHMPDPGAALRGIAACLAPGGTARIMVYNTPGRAWIHELQAIFKLLRISPFDAADRDLARRIVTDLGNALPGLARKLAQMGRATLANDARFVDTFLHAREARLSITRWLSLIEEAGLRARGLLDRYGELDDLPNPLWSMPAAATLEERAADLRFEGNLELFLEKPGEAPRAVDRRPSPLLRWKAPPSLWLSFDETRDVRLGVRLALWRAFLDALAGDPRGALDPMAHKLTRPALQRLARLGAILPSQLQDPARRALAAAPMADAMEAPDVPATDDRDLARARALIDDDLRRRGLATARRAAAVAARVTRLARPLPGATN